MVLRRLSSVSAVHEIETVTEGGMSLGPIVQVFGTFAFLALPSRWACSVDTVSLP